ncbi:MAG: LexA family protein [Patescibacteria group bacterium]|jgi:repressor LexA
MDYNKLTENQKKVLDVIVENIKTLGYPPTVREIKERTDIKSLRGITLQLLALEINGFIKRKKGSRGIIVDPSVLNPNEETYISIDLMDACIPAGSPSIIDVNVDTQIKVSLTQTKGVRNVIAVRVKGDSMNKVGIDDGDYALIMPQLVASDGDIVAALHDNCGITLKKYRIVEGVPILFPSSTNPDHKPIVGPFTIQGKLISVLKEEEVNKNVMDIS